MELYLNRPVDPTLRVELLSDDKGIFGVGVVGSSGIHSRVLLRPDSVAADQTQVGPLAVAYQPVVYARPFYGTVERALCHDLFCSMVMRNPRRVDESRPLAEDSVSVPRSTFFGYRELARRIVNSVISEGLAAAAPVDLLRTVRRFPIQKRAPLYAAFCRYGERARQLAETFPVLALQLFASARPNVTEAAAIAMVLRGVTLKKIADRVGLSMTYRKWKQR